MENKFINLEDEIELRRAVRATHKHEGMTGVYQAMGELAASLQVVVQMAEELLNEEDKNKGGLK